ncbi:MAG: 5'-nucleotidase C-terminal domain-containing protein [Gemmatimonadales bacterium]
MFLALLLAAALQVQSPASDTTHLVIVATTDVHGYATAWDYYADAPFAGGLVRATTAVDSLRRLYPGRVVLVDAGDLIQGNPFDTYFARVAPRHPHPVLDAMGAMAYDAATPGNHEFNYGLPFMRGALADATFPYVSGNIYTLPADTLMYPPYIVIERAGIRVGITGFTTPGVMVWDGATVRGQARVAPITANAGRVLEGMHREADLTIALVHGGLREGSSYDTTGVGPENDAAGLAAGPWRPDLVVVGHTHRAFADSVIGGVHFIQPRNYAQSLGVVHIDLVREGGAWKPVRIRGQLLPLAGVAPSPVLSRRLAAAHAEVRRWVDEPIGAALGPMPARTARAEASPLVTYLNDLQRRRSGAELAATAVFDTGAGFDGDIRVRDVARLYPYENTLKAIRITGAQLKDYLEQSARYYTVDPSGRVGINDSIAGYNFDIVTGAEYAIDLRFPPGNRIRSLTVRSRPVGPDSSYTLALNSYRQAGGGGFAMLQGAPVVYDRGENIRDLIVDDIRARRLLHPEDYGAANWRIAPPALALAARRLFAPTPAPARPGPLRDTVALRILGINDFHGQLLPKVQSWSDGRPVGGIGAVKGLMDSLARACDCPGLRLDAGDEMQGTIPSNQTWGRTTIDALNRLGLSVAAIGNHDFDWSVDTLLRRMSESRYRWVSANILDSTTGRRPDWAVPYRMVEAGRFKVAVVGYTTTETRSIVRGNILQGLTFAGPDVLPAVIREARAQGADLVVLVAHAGAFCADDHETGCKGEIIDLARSLDSGSVDLIVSGHTHTLVNTRVNGIPIVQAGSSGSAVALADVVKTVVAGLEVRTRLFTVYADSIRPDSQMVVLMDRLRRQSDSLMNRPIATLKAPMSRSGPQYPLGNLIADAQRNAARADIGLMNNGGIRSGLLAGTVTYGELFEVQPFQNAVMRLTITGRRLRDLLELALRGDEPSVHLSGLRVRYDSTRPPGRRVREMRLLNGRKVEDKQTYVLAVNDFLAGGKDGFTLLADLPQETTGVLDLDALAAYLQRLPQPVEPPADLRFIPE